MSSEAERMEVGQRLAAHPAAWRIWRGAVQMADHQRAALTPDQWQQMLAALAAFGAALLRIFLGGTLAGPETQPAPQPVKEGGPVQTDPQTGEHC